MINIKFSFSTGQVYSVTENSTTTLSFALQKLIRNENLEVKINSVLCGGFMKNLNKTFLENKIKNGEVLVVLVETNSASLQQSISNNRHDILEKCLDFLINGCKVPSNIFDKRGNCLGDWEIGRKNGPPGYLKDYYPPIGWTGIGLQALNLYDDRDNEWLGSKNTNGEWYIAYHGIKSIDALKGILSNGFRRGIYQNCKNYTNINPLTNRDYPTCGEGVYFIQNFLETQKYIISFNYLGDNYRVILMCRVNPYKVRIADIGNNLESWIVNGDKLNDINGKRRDDEVRVYRILVFMDR